MSSNELDRFLANARGSAATAKIYSLDELRARRGEQSQARWGLSALRGRLVELSARGATATLTVAMELVGEAQEQSEPVAWLTLSTGTFYPPDVADSGIDLAALVVVRCPDATTAARAAERFLRSGAFGLVILDLGDKAADVTLQIQGRLVTLAQSHDAAVVCLTEKSADTASLGSLVSLRAEALRQRPERAHAALRPPNGEFAVEVRVLKDKRSGPGFTRSLERRGPAGLT
jgi:recombination protein RecA